MKIDDLIKMIEEKGILTGSRALWGAGEESDWDYMLLMSDYDEIQKILEVDLNWNISEFSEYGNREMGGTGLYFDYMGKEYNLIGLEKKDFIAWTRTLELLRKLPESVKSRIDKAGRKNWYLTIYHLFCDAL